MPRGDEEEHENWEQVGPLLERVLEGLGLYKRIREWRALRHWPSVAGDKMAARSSPVRVEKGVLWLNVAGPHWAAEISVRKKELLDGLNAAAGSEVLKDIRFVGAWDRSRTESPRRNTSQD